MSATRRLFFALWPDDRLRAGIVQRQQALGEIARRRVAKHNLHLTLLFLGDQPQAVLPELMRQAAGLDSPPFNLTLDRVGWFARAGVVWMGGPAVEQGRRLVYTLSAAVQEAGVEPDPRPWAPHVTLFRQMRGRPELPEIQPMSWMVREFSLIESIPGQPYQVLRTWSLQSDDMS